MTPSRLWTRLERLEEQASHLYCSADMMAELLTYLAQAGTQAALAPEVLQPLCTAVRHRLEDFAQQFPAGLRERRDPRRDGKGSDDDPVGNHPGRDPRAEYLARG